MTTARSPFAPCGSVLECDIAAMNEVAKLNPGLTVGEIRALHELSTIIDEDDLAADQAAALIGPH